MRGNHIAQFVAALLVAITPWCVVHIAFLMARRHAREVRIPLVRPPVVRQLDWLTIAALVAAGAAALALSNRPRWLAVLDLAIFAVLAVAGLRSLAAIEENSRPARQVDSTVRVASLRPRRLADYVPRTWRAALITIEAAGLAAIAWRLTTPSPDRRLLVPLTFALSAVVFSFLYEVWMNELSNAGHVVDERTGEATPDAFIRQVFAVEVFLVLSCLGVGHALLDLDWERHGVWGAAVALVGACVGVAGCAIAIASGLVSRRHRTV
jgi:hypothetical protein